MLCFDAAVCGLVLYCSLRAILQGTESSQTNLFYYMWLLQPRCHGMMHA
jgi:hypothetical protein